MYKFITTEVIITYMYSMASNQYWVPCLLYPDQWEPHCIQHVTLYIRKNPQQISLWMWIAPHFKQQLSAFPKSLLCLEAGMCFCTQINRQWLLTVLVFEGWGTSNHHNWQRCKGLVVRRHWPVWKSVCLLTVWLFSVFLAFLSSEKLRLNKILHKEPILL